MRKPTPIGIKSQSSKVGQIIPGILPSWVGQTITGISGSSHFRNSYPVRQLPQSV